MTAPNTSLVPPQAVRVWRGYRTPGLDVQQFYDKLGAVFVPATVKMQIEAGLHAYAPTVLAGLPRKPNAVPDETAILFWESQETYWNGFTRLAVRTYTMTHNGVYVMDNNKSGADFPVFFDGTALVPEKPVYLFEQPADWMHGAISHLVAARPATADFALFQAAVTKALADIQAHIPLAGAIACIGGDYLVYWELAPLARTAKQAPSGIPALQAVLSGWSQTFVAAPTFLPVGLWDEWTGMSVCAGSSFNMQFDRRVTP